MPIIYHYAAKARFHGAFERWFKNELINEPTERLKAVTKGNLRNPQKSLCVNFSWMWAFYRITAVLNANMNVVNCWFYPCRGYSHRASTKSENTCKAYSFFWRGQSAIKTCPFLQISTTLSYFLSRGWPIFACIATRRKNNSRYLILKCQYWTHSEHIWGKSNTVSLKFERKHLRTSMLNRDICTVF